MTQIEIVLSENSCNFVGSSFYILVLTLAAYALAQKSCPPGSVADGADCGKSM